MTSCGSTSLSSSARQIVASALLLATAPPAGPSPQRLAIYYGYPSLVNGAAGALEAAAFQLSPFNVIVLGDGLEFDTVDGGHAGPVEHAFTVRLLERLSSSPRRPSVFGYIDLGRTQQLSIDQVVDRIDRWAAMGVAGIFFDEAGFDFGVTRDRLNRAVDAAHGRGLAACVNAFRPEDVFGDQQVPVNAAGGGNPAGTRSVMGPRDAILLEPFAVGAGAAETPASLTRRMRAAIDGRQRFGTRVFAIAAGGEDGDAQYGWWLAAAFGLDGYGWSAPGYGAATSQLSWVPPPDAEDRLRSAAFTDREARFEDGVWRRSTTAGTIVVGSAGHHGALAARRKGTSSWNGRMR